MLSDVSDVFFSFHFYPHLELMIYSDHHCLVAPPPITSIEHSNKFEVAVEVVSGELTPLKINMSPKKRTLSIGNTFSNHHFSGDMLVFKGNVERVGASKNDVISLFQLLLSCDVTTRSSFKMITTR